MPDRRTHSTTPGILGRGQNQIEKDRNELEQALKTYRELAREDPAAYLPHLV